MKKPLLLLSVLISISYSQKLTQVVKTYQNGEKRSEGNYKDGKVDGLYRFWYENGQKSIEFDSGSDGKSTSWYQNGQKSFERFYRNGKDEGLEIYWYESGQKYRELVYLDGVLTSEKKWNEDGSVRE